MIRTQICLTKREKDELQNKAKEMGLSMADLIRRIIDNYLEIKK